MVFGVNCVLACEQEAPTTAASERKVEGKDHRTGEGVDGARHLCRP